MGGFRARGHPIARPDTNDTWEWTGEDWVVRSPAQPPSARRGFVLAFDTARSRVVMFGGGGAQKGNPKIAETWEYAASAIASYTSYGSGCAGSAGTPRLAPAAGSLPWAGEPFTLQLSSLPAAASRTPFLWLGVSRTSFGAIPLPFALDPLGMTGCTLYAQGGVLDPAANPFGATVSDAGSVGIAVR